MTLQSAPHAATQRGAWVVDLLQQGSLPGVPEIRIQALREASRVAQTEEILIDIFLDAIGGSPYLEDHESDFLVELLLMGQWDHLSKALGVANPISPKMMTTLPQRLTDFKEMAISIFRASRKIKKLSGQHRISIGSSLLNSSSQEEILDVLINIVSKSLNMSEHTRTLIANDLFDGYYHRLLQADRFDCDEKPRIESTYQKEEREECSICFGPFPNGEVRRLPACGHEFCPDCITDWARENGNSFPCPMCRTENTFGDYDEKDVQGEPFFQSR